MPVTAPRPIRVFRLAGKMTARNGQSDGWRDLREAIAAKPLSIPVFRTRRSRLDQLRPGEKLLLTMRYAGIGDHIVASMMFPALRDQYPEIQVSYAIPSAFHPLFDGTGVRLVAHDGPVQSEWLKQYDLIEDINTPCHQQENFFVRYGGTVGDGNGLRWKHRLDMMSHWFGLHVSHPHSEIRVREEEKAEARRRIAASGTDKRPLCLFSPISGSQSRSYPWFAELAAALDADGWCVRYLHAVQLPGRFPTVAALPLRLMGAACAVADLIVSTDTSTFHWAGILGRPAVAFFNSQNGVNHCRDYPTVHPVQTCATPCIHNVRWGNDHESCPLLTRETLPDTGGIPVSRCFGRATVQQILRTVRLIAHGGNV